MHIHSGSGNGLKLEKVPYDADFLDLEASNFIPLQAKVKKSVYVIIGMLAGASTISLLWLLVG